MMAGGRVIDFPGNRRNSARGVDVPPDMTTWDGALVGYRRALQAAGRARGTVKLSLYYLELLAEELPAPWEVDTATLEGQSKFHWKPETRKSARTATRGFYRWGLRRGFIERDPAADLLPVRVPPPSPRPTPDGVILDALSRADRRVQLMLLLGALAGLRAGEIAQVHERDLVGGVLMVHGKGGKVRWVPVRGDLGDRLEAVRGWAFPSPWSGSHLTAGHVTKLLSEALPPGWTAHTLRHRMATKAYAGTRDLLAVGALLGHSRPETTQRYVRLPEDALGAAVDAAGLLAS